VLVWSSRSPRQLLGSLWLVVSCAAAPAQHEAAATKKPAAAVPAATTKAPPPCSDDMVLVERTCVDRYEAHLLESRADGTLAPHPAHEPPEQKRYVAASSAGVKPQGFISQVLAADACQNAGKRLCGLTEWYRACTGSEKTTYPYGASYEKGRCNVGKNHLLSELHGANPNAWSYLAFNDPELAKRPGFLALTGEYDRCTSPEGVHDMVGNLHEWVADRVDATLRSKLPVPVATQRRLGRHPGNGIFMGGFFSTMNQHGKGCNFATTAHDPRYHDYSTGFRCCKDAGASE
jgi:sulfatase modifying factor 1